MKFESKAQSYQPKSCLQTSAKVNRIKWNSWSLLEKVKKLLSHYIHHAVSNTVVSTFLSSFILLLRCKDSLLELRARIKEENVIHFLQPRRRRNRSKKNESKQNKFRICYVIIPACKRDEKSPLNCLAYLLHLQPINGLLPLQLL